MSDEISNSPGGPVDTDARPSSALTPQQRGALIRHSGKAPIASLPPSERAALIQSVLQRYLDDEDIGDIAQDIGVAKTSLYQAIVKYAPDDWVSAQGSRAICDMDMAEREMMRAGDMLAVSRARELLRSTQWKAERTLRRLYGDAAPKTDSGRISITLNVGSMARPSDNLTIDQAPSYDGSA